MRCDAIRCGGGCGGILSWVDPILLHGNRDPIHHHHQRGNPHTAHSIINQACHATAKAIHVFREHPATRAYLADVDHMHKVTLEVWVLGAG